MRWAPRELPLLANRLTKGVGKPIGYQGAPRKHETVHTVS